MRARAVAGSTTHPRPTRGWRDGCRHQHPSTTALATTRRDGRRPYAYAWGRQDRTVAYWEFVVGALLGVLATVLVEPYLRRPRKQVERVAQQVWNDPRC
jgi:hypothetical protein